MSDTKKAAGAIALGAILTALVLGYLAYLFG